MFILLFRYGDLKWMYNTLKTYRMPLLLYQINLIRSLLIQDTVARHGDLALQIGLIGYYT